MLHQKMKLAAGCAAVALLAGMSALAQPPAAPAAPGAAPAAAPRPPQAPRPPGPGGAIPTNRGQAIKDGVQIQIPMYEDVFATLDALPTIAPAKPKKPRKVLVFARANGFVHSVIPLTAFTVKELGDHTGAWSTDISYDLKDFTAANLAKYDVLFLDNTTGAFLDDTDAAATAARKQALLDFVRGGKGIAATHATTDSYHTNGAGPNATPGGPKGTWPEWNKLIGGYFKFHWVYPQQITVKIDDPKSPITAGFGGKEYIVHDETYTFAQDSFSRKNVHVLTSVDYSKMSDADKALEPAATKRTDGDYALSYIRREGKGRVFYAAHGHSEHVLAMPAYLKQLLAGIQYAAGDLAADDSPSAK